MEGMCCASCSFLTSLSLEPATWLPQLPPKSLEGKGVFRQDLQGIDSWGKEKMKSQQPQENIPGYYKPARGPPSHFLAAPGRAAAKTQDPQLSLNHR